MTGKLQRFYVFKNGEKCDRSNYRPISIISAVAEVFGKIVYNQFYSYLLNNNLLSNYQSGFRATFSSDIFIKI